MPWISVLLAPIRRWRRSLVLLAVATVLAGCGLFGQSEDSELEPGPGPDDGEQASFLIAPVSAYAAPPCGPTAVLDGQQCLVLGTAWLTEAAFESASWVTEGGDVVVDPVLTEDGVGRLNKIAARCVAMTGDCETGQVAVVDDGGLIAAPTVTAERFDRDQLRIIGNLDEERAAALVDLLNG